MSPETSQPSLMALDLNTIHQGCCLDLMRHISSGSIDMILCDLPYGTTACKWDTIIPFDKLWAQYNRIIRPNGAIILTASQPFTTVLISSNMSGFRYCWVWNKTRPSNFPLAKKQPMKYHEDIAVFGKTSPNYFPQMVKASKVRKKGKNDGYAGFNSGLKNPAFLDKKYTDFYPSSIQVFSNHNGGNVHPTQKPVALFEYLISTYTNPGEVVLDNCIGSGTTAIAALNTNRRFIGIEQEQKYVAIANQRIIDWKFAQVKKNIENPTFWDHVEETERGTKVILDSAIVDRSKLFNFPQPKP